MKIVILCGGLGTRLSEETQLKPKPMVEIGGRPILWHIMKIYERFGFGDFVLALGYKGDSIKDYFLNYHARKSDLTIELASNSVTYKNPLVEGWTVTMADTGANTMTGGRLLRLSEIVKPSGTFLLTYGDGVSDVDLSRLLDFHKSHGRLATVTAVRPPVRFGELSISDGRVTSFEEKPQAREGWINGGFFVFEPAIFDYIDGDGTMLERQPLERMAREGELMAYLHGGFWQCMDTLRDKHLLEELWGSGTAPWAK
jgi:glucose-1-phosphate cytidylyltransferase